ncbi:response regulator [Rhodosalinus sediminis]|uniref:histidine kinase n=1 Tax=Rhodosalinus sediminis TaxID=1940533 RepID=A0A3D9BWF0_9RHOB|nr:response regulator [Rhodosalinus sediminis]REC57860.1 response regulator [Rhodosalinus sediminis]
MSLSTELAEERRARRAAERLLEQKQAELFEAKRKLGQHARALSEQIVETKAEVATVRDENARVKSDLSAANEKIAIVETQLWQALESVRDGFAMFNADGRLELANSAYLSVFGGIASIAPGASFAHVVDVMIEEGIVDLQGEPGIAWRERMLARWDMAEIPPEVIRFWNGQFVKLMDRRTPDGGLVTLAVNNTELMRMWSAVEELPDGFVVYDSDDRLVTCNARYRELYAETAPAMVPGATFEELLRYGLARGQYAEAIGREEEWLAERLEKHRAAEVAIEQQLGDGRWLRIFEKETRDGGRVGLRVDVTALKEQQKALERATERAEAANRAKSAFLANMTHEIRTPMNGVVGMAELLADTELTEDQSLYVETIRASGESLLVIINDVLDYSKIEADRLALHPEPFDLERCIHEIVMLLQPSARDKGLVMLVDYDLFLPTRFVGDPARVRQVLTNLIGNAVKFTPAGHVLVRVTGVPESGDGAAEVIVTVEDTGIGIPAERLEHVFGEFNQVEDDRNRSFEGTGLGLAISRRLIDLMGGQIWVESEEGAGTCFGLRVPLPAAEAVEEAPSGPPALGTALVVDDHPTNREILQKQLAALGVEVRCAESAEAAAPSLSPPPDVVLTDHLMPGVDGVRFARRLRAEGHAMPILLLSSNPSMVEPDLEPGVLQAVLQKPLPRHELLRRLHGLGGVRGVAAPTAAPATGQARAARPMRVLLAEDNRTNQLVFSRMVQGLDVDLAIAANGHEALAAWEAGPPDLIFMDISMPGMDGREAAREIRRREGAAGAARVPIVAVTAHAMEGDRDAILGDGIDGYISKPVRKAALLDAIRAHRPAAARPPAPEGPG